ncbi:MAG: FAD-binding oxidoreductase [Acidobacteriales bacterium]|nr:FAD-binding oxidoreductase [Terriglobales bacterium]
MIEQLSNSQMLSAHLGTIVGSEHVSIAKEAIAVAPADAAQAAAVLRFANDNGLPVSPVGGATKKGWGNPVSSKITLHTHRMNALLEHTWQDMTCTVQAGCPWSSMQAALARHGQFVALDPLWPDHATVGGVMATNDSGTLRLKYGGLRDLIIGMTVVLADGTIARTGGKVVKNVAGYDLHKLMIGAFGTLGLTTEITFRLHSLPVSSQSFTLLSQTVEPLGDLLLQLIDSHLSAQSIQLRIVGDSFGLDIQLGALPEVLKEQSSLLLEMAKKAKLSVEEASNEVWNSRHLLFADANGFTIKATMLPSDIARFTSMAHGFGGTAVTQATGIMTAFLPEGREEAILQLRREFTGSGGSLVILQQPANGSVDLLDPPSNSFPLMQKIKQQFDPNRILNPGVFLGGI